MGHTIFVVVVFMKLKVTTAVESLRRCRGCRKKTHIRIRSRQSNMCVCVLRMIWVTIVVASIATLSIVTMAVIAFVLLRSVEIVNVRVVPAVAVVVVIGNISTTRATVVIDNIEIVM